MRGDGTLYKRTIRDKGGAERVVWYAQYFVNGARHRESTGVPVGKDEEKSENRARLYLRRRVRAIEDGTFAPGAHRVTFERLAELIEADYEANGRRSTRRLQTSLKHLRERFAGAKAQDIERRMPDYIAARLKDGAARGSVNLEIACMRRMLNLAKRQRLLAGKPDLPGLALRNARKGFLEPGTLAKILDKLPKRSVHLRPLIEFLSLTGWRRGEAVNLTWHAVDFAGGVVRLSPTETKGGEPRVFPFAAHPRLKALLETQRARADAIQAERSRLVLHVFPKPDGEPVGEFYSAWRTACRKAGAPGAIVHDLRRTAARSMERAGVSRSVAMRLLGHKTAAIFSRYAITSESDLSDGVARLAAQDAAPVRKVGQQTDS